MENNKTYFTDLITRYLTGEATSDEMITLSGWLKSSAENQKVFEEYQKTFDAIEETKINSTIDVDVEWKNIRSKISKPAEAKKEVKVVTLDTEYKIRPAYFSRFMRVAAIFILIATSAFLLYYYLRSDQPMTQHMVAQVESIESKLPDGTSVTLNSGSTLDYPAKFGKNKRTVALKGEAYFNVVHDATKPFIISAEDVSVEVLGTSFYVNTSSSEGQGEVILTSGRVAVFYKNNPGKITILEPGEKAVFSKTEQKITKTENDETNYMAFKTKDLVFSSTPLCDVIKTLNNVYHSKITLRDKKIANLTLNGNFVNLTLDSVLKIIQEALPVCINKSKGNVIEISSNGSKQ